MRKIALSNISFRSTNGFSLIELLVVISIIGILVAIGLASYVNIQQKARDATRRTDIQSIAQAMEQYYQDNNAYPIGTAMIDESLNLAQSNTQNSLSVLENTSQLLKKLQPWKIAQVFAAIPDGDVSTALLVPYFTGPFPTTPKDDGSGAFEYNVTADSEGTIFCACAKLEAESGGNAVDPGFFGDCNFDENIPEFGQYYCQASRQ